MICLCNMYFAFHSVFLLLFLQRTLCIMCRKFGICLVGPYGLAKEHAYLLGSGVAQPSRASPRQAAPSPPHLIANRSPKRPRHGTECRRCRRLRFRRPRGPSPPGIPLMSSPSLLSFPPYPLSPAPQNAGRPAGQFRTQPWPGALRAPLFRAPGKKIRSFFLLIHAKSGRG